MAPPHPRRPPLQSPPISASTRIFLEIHKGIYWAKGSTGEHPMCRHHKDNTRASDNGTEDETRCGVRAFNLQDNGSSKLLSYCTVFTFTWNKWHGSTISMFTVFVTEGLLLGLHWMRHSCQISRRFFVHQGPLRSIDSSSAAAKLPTNPLSSISIRFALLNHS